MDKIKIIVLAAGHGKRMGNKELPKVLIELKGKPIIKYLLEAVRNSGVDDKPVVVIGQRAEEVKLALGSEYTYIFQTEQLGTGHAVLCTKEELENKAENIMVLYGDHPFVSPEMIKNLAKTHLKENKILTMATVRVPDYNNWRKPLYDFGRIIRDSQGEVCQIIERRDATPQQLKIKEGNPSYFCFKADWLWQNLAQLKNNNVQGEYYLTDLAGIACQQGQEIATVKIEPKEALGINTAGQLKVVENLMS